MLTFGLVQSPLRFGLAEGVDPHHAPFGTLVTAENVLWRKSGRVEKRFGTEQLPRNIFTSTTIQSAARLLVRGNELALIDGETLYGWSPGLQAWRIVDRVPSLGLTWETILDTVESVDATDVALSSGGLLVHAWTTAGNPANAGGMLRVQIRDRVSGQLVMAPTRLGSTTDNRGVRVLILGSTVVIVTRTGTNISAYAIDLVSFAVSGPTNLRTDAVGNAFDAVVNGSLFTVAYNATGPALQLYSYNASLLQQATGTIAETMAVESIGIDANFGLVTVGYSRNNGGTRDVRFAVANATTLAQTLAPVTLESDPGIAWSVAVRMVSPSGVSPQGNIIAFTRNVLAADPLNDSIRTTTYAFGTLGTFTANSRRTTYGAALRCRPFVVNGRTYALVSDAALAILGTPQSAQTYESYLVEVETVSVAMPPNHQPHRFVGKLDHLIAGFPSEYTPPNSVQVSATELALPSLFYVELPRRLQSNFSMGVRLVSITSGAALPVDTWRSVGYGLETYVAGAILTAYDGRSLADYGYARPPWIHKIAPSTTGGLMLAGNYLYAAHQERVSAVGVKHRSATVSTPTPITTTGTTSSVTLTFGGVNVSRKGSMPNQAGQSPVVPSLLALYRSTAGGANYYRLTYDPTFNVLLVDESSALQSFVDTRADAAIDGNAVPLSVRPLLYTAGGVLDDEQPPAGTTLHLHKQRLWLVDGTEQQIWFSKSFLDDAGVAPGFSTDFRLLFEQKITALATLDERRAKDHRARHAG